MISKELFETLTDELIDLFERTRTEKLSYDEFYKEMEKIRKKHNISKAEMSYCICFIDDHMRGNLDA